MSVEMTCILCPMGCQLRVTQDESGVRVEGNDCPRGAKYGEQELLAPMRTVTSSARASGSSLPLCPVKTLGQVPKPKIPDVLQAIRTLRVAAPIRIGDTLIENVANTGVNIVATANIRRRP